MHLLIIIRIKKNKNRCIDCGKELSDKNSKRCLKCSAKHVGELNQKIKWPSTSELYSLILQNSFLKISKDLGVSDNAVRKCCKRYGIPFKCNEIKELRKNNIDYETYINNKKKFFKT